MSDITALIPTCCIPSAPDTRIIDQVIDSIHEQLPDTRIIIMCDGLREELKDRENDYLAYVQRLKFKYLPDPRMVIIEHKKHEHQATMTRKALTIVETPLILYVEHDTPIIGKIDWEGLSTTLEDGLLNVIRFSHDTEVYLKDGHKRLHLDDAKPINLGDITVQRTSQWSQRPHIATAKFYRWMIEHYFEPDCNTFIELVMHGVVANTYLEHGELGWEKFKLAIYIPETDILNDNGTKNIQRSFHLNGNEGGPKFFDMRFRYPNGITPEGAPGQSE